MIYKILEMCYELLGNILLFILKNWKKGFEGLMFFVFYMRDSFGNCIYSLYVKCIIIYM